VKEKEQKISIKSDGGLSEAEIEQMVKDAEANAEADKKKREAIDTKNQADALVHSTDKTLEEHGDKVDSETKDSIVKAKEDLAEAIKNDDVEDIKTKQEALIKVSQKLGEAIYKEAQAQQAPEANGSSDEGEVIDAEVVNEEKK
jgi:molecular chaperone DnaK